MKTFAHPSGAAFLEALGGSLIFCQAFIQRGGAGFDLRHADDAAAADGSLRKVTLPELRALAQFTEAGAFRPLKSAPNLARGWLAKLAGADELLAALHILYPGAVADWFAAQLPTPPLTSYRDFTARQTGMYRITSALPDAPAGAAIAACCHQDFCLKRRLWTVDGLAPDGAAAKSVIPCLEPCAVMLEFARKVARLEQGVDPNPAAESSGAECDFDTPDNPRRRRFVLEKAARAATSAP